MMCFTNNKKVRHFLNYPLILSLDWVEFVAGAWW